jgi:mono/diheme cytochrome c family protein
VLRQPTPALALSCLCLFGLGCEAEDWSPARLSQGKSVESVEQLKKGRDVFANYCAGCHGENGDGNGAAARFLDPKPRNFKLGRLKFAAVESGQPPRDEDYLRIIDSGLAGTAMPSFRLLPGDEKKALVAYVKTFYPDWKDDPPGALLTSGADPFRDDPASGVELGRKTYHSVALCWSCHPAYESRAEIAKIYAEAKMEAPELRPNLFEGEAKDSNWGAPITAPDFLIDRIKTGADVENLARVIASGVGGTAMPTWAGSLEPKQIWGLAYYVNTVAQERGTPAGRAKKLALLSEGTKTP